MCVFMLFRNSTLRMHFVCICACECVCVCVYLFLVCGVTPFKNLSVLCWLAIQKGPTVKTKYKASEKRCFSNDPRLRTAIPTVYVCQRWSRDVMVDSTNSVSGA